MKINRFFIFAAVMVVFSMVLAACQMPASTPPPGVDTSPAVTDSGFPRPEDVTNPFEGLEMMATQTALAAEGGAGQVVVTQEPGVDQPTTEVQPEVTSAPPPVEETQPAVVESVPSPTAGVPQSYTLQPFEFPYCIARRFNVNPAELLAINNLSRYSIVLAGTTLRMPQTGNPFPGERALINTPDTYTVRAGDTIYKIACLYGNVDPVYMAQYNGLKAPYSLETGQTLQIP
jgi:LysM repeat protein